MYLFLYLFLFIPILCITDFIFRQPEAIAADLLAKCPLPRDSKICNPDSILAKDEVEDVEYVLQANCETVDSIGIYISKPPSNNIEQGFLIRKVIGEVALTVWYPDCKLSIFFVIWITNGQLICSGFRRLLSPLNPIDLKELCDEEIKKNATMVETLRGIIMNTRRHVSLKNKKDIVVSLSYSKLSIILSVMLIIALATLATGIYFCYIGRKKYKHKALNSAEIPLNGYYRIRSYNTYLRANKFLWTVNMVPAAPDDSETWFIEEYEDGKVALKAYRASSKPKQYLSSSSDGSLSLESHAMTRELWTYCKNKDDSWSFKSYDGKWLSADKNYRVKTTENCNASEKFRLERCDSPTIRKKKGKDEHKILQTVESLNGTYLRANKSEWTVGMVPYPPGASENWFLEEHNDLVALKGHGGSNKPEQYLSAQSDGSVKLERHASNNEMWRPLDNGKGFWSFQTDDGKYLSAGMDGRVFTTKKHDMFLLKRSPTRAELSAKAAGLHCIKSPYHNTFLRANEASMSVDMAPSSTAISELWYIEDHKGQVAFKAYVLLTWKSCIFVFSLVELLNCRDTLTIRDLNCGHLLGMILMTYGLSKLRMDCG